LTTHVCRLRRKLDDVANVGDRIKTIRSVGYQLAVSAAGSAPAFAGSGWISSPRVVLSDGEQHKKLDN